MAGGEAVDLYEIACFLCGRALRLCVSDYRGQRYCLGGQCRRLGYRARSRERGRRYQRKEKGRQKHRGRQESLRNRRQGAGEPQGSAAVSAVGEQANLRAAASRPVDGRVTHAATGEGLAVTATVSPVADSATAESALQEELSGVGSENVEPGKGAAAARRARPRLFRCALCARAGLVVLRFSAEHPEGVRLFGPLRA
jgi:hypothetical protein